MSLTKMKLGLFFSIPIQEYNSHLVQSLILMVAMPPNIEPNQVNFHRVHVVSRKK